MIGSRLRPHVGCRLFRWYGCVAPTVVYWPLLIYCCYYSHLTPLVIPQRCLVGPTLSVPSLHCYRYTDCPRVIYLLLLLSVLAWLPSLYGCCYPNVPTLWQIGWWILPVVDLRWLLLLTYVWRTPFGCYGRRSPIYICCTLLTLDRLLYDCLRLYFCYDVYHYDYVTGLTLPHIPDGIYYSWSRTYVRLRLFVTVTPPYRCYRPITPDTLPTPFPTFTRSTPAFPVGWVVTLPPPHFGCWIVYRVVVGWYFGICSTYLRLSRSGWICCYYTLRLLPTHTLTGLLVHGTLLLPPIYAHFPDVAIPPRTFGWMVPVIRFVQYWLQFPCHSGLLWLHWRCRVLLWSSLFTFACCYLFLGLDPPPLPVIICGYCYVEHFPFVTMPVLHLPFPTLPHLLCRDLFCWPVCSPHPRFGCGTLLDTFDFVPFYGRTFPVTSLLHLLRFWLRWSIYPLFFPYPLFIPIHWCHFVDSRFQLLLAFITTFAFVIYYALFVLLHIPLFYITLLLFGHLWLLFRWCPCWKRKTIYCGSQWATW